MATTKELLAKALSLPFEQRVELAEALLGHLEGEKVEADVDRLWASELDSRAERVADGRGEFVDALEHLRRLRARLRNRT